MGISRHIVFALLMALFMNSAHADNRLLHEFSTSPRSNGEQKWRIGYFEGGAYRAYYDTLRSVVEGLMELGWIDMMEVPDSNSKSTQALWAWLSTNATSEYIEFASGAHYSANWDQETRERLREELINRLNEQKDLDLIFAMGTWAGKDLANDEHSTPTIVMSASDPVHSEIIDSIRDSGRDHIYARVDPLRYERQLRVFHDVIGFKKLGVAYEDTQDGRSYAAMDLVQKVAKERGFEVVRCFTQSDIADQQQAGRSVVECFDKLVTEVDAIYITSQGGVNAQTIPTLVSIANEHRIPTFSQAGFTEVEYGFLLSLSRSSYKPVGLFLAATVAKVLNGASPRQLDQLFEESPTIAINLKTAELIGLYLYADVLAAADKIYREIATPN